MLNFLIAGFGKIGTEHLKAIKKIKLKKKFGYMTLSLMKNHHFQKKHLYLN